jgi:hypothetical protein
VKLSNPRIANMKINRSVTVAASFRACLNHVVAGEAIRASEGLDPDMDPSRNEPIAILFANQAPDAFQTAAADGRFFDRLFTAEHFLPSATRG